MRAVSGSVFDDGWELRVTGRALREDLGLSDGAHALEHSETLLGKLLEYHGDGAQLAADPQEVDGEQLFLLTGDGVSALLSQDLRGTFWVLAVAEDALFDAHVRDLVLSGALWPADRDAWRQRSDDLAHWIDNIRTAAPLLHLRSIENDGRLSVLAMGDAELSIEETPDALFVGLRIGIECSPQERSRLAATAVASVRPVPGWVQVDHLPSAPPDDERLAYSLPKEPV